MHVQLSMFWSMMPCTGDGGALCVTDIGTSLEASDLTFTRNLAVSGSGGGVAAGPGTVVQLEASSFSGDSAGAHGGAMASIKAMAMLAANMTIRLGVAKSNGGGLYAQGVSSLMFVGVDIEGTTSGLGGGGVYLQDVQDATVQDVSILVSAPAPSATSSAPSKRRRLQSSVAAAAAGAQCSAAAGASAGAGPPGGGLFITGATTVAVTRTTLTVGPLAVGWKGQGLAMELDQASVCNSTAESGNNAGAGSINSSCSAVALLETRFVSTPGWEPGPLDRPLYASSLAGWSAQCTSQAPDNATTGQCSNQTADCPSTPAPSSQSMLEQLRTGAAGRPHASDLANCLGGSLAGAASQLTSILLLPPVALGLTLLQVNNSRTLSVIAHGDAPAIFPDTNSTFSVGVMLLDEGGQLVTGGWYGVFPLRFVLHAPNFP